MLLRRQLKQLHACHDAIEWVSDRTLEEAWQECAVPDWMMRLIAASLTSPSARIRCMRVTALCVCKTLHCIDNEDLREEHEAILAEIISYTEGVPVDVTGVNETAYYNRFDIDKGWTDSACYVWAATKNATAVMGSQSTDYAAVMTSAALSSSLIAISLHDNRTEVERFERECCEVIRDHFHVHEIHVGLDGRLSFNNERNNK